MFGIGKKNRLLPEESEKLIVALKRVERPRLTSRQSSAMKERVMLAISQNRHYDPVPASVRKLAEGLKAVAGKIIIPAHLAAILKERVMSAVEEKANAVNLSFYGRHFRLVTASVMLFVFVSTSFFAMPYGIPVTHAGTYLRDVVGDVLVWRDGMYLEARQDLALNEGDMVVTLSDGAVTIHFLDESVGRLGGNTGVEIKRLYSDPRNPVSTKVLLFLKEGKMLARVGNLVDDKSVFSVETDKALAEVPKKGAFDVVEAAERTKIAVYDNMVDVRTVNKNGDLQVKTVLAGYSAEVQGGDSPEIAVKSIERDDPEMIASTAWLDENEKTEADNKALEGLADSSGVGEDEVEGTDESQIIVDADVEAQKAYFMGKYGELTRAETMFVRGNHKEGSRLLRSFRRGVSNILAGLPELQSKDPVGTMVLKNLMREKIAVQMKDLSPFLPGDRLYPVKEQIQDVELLLAESRVERINLRISQAENKLLEIQELLEEDKIGYAPALLNDYRDRMDQLVLIMSEAESAMLEDILLNLVSQQVRQVKVLTSIEGSLAGTTSVDFLNQISVLRREIMIKMLGTLDEIRDRVPSELMMGLKDVFDTYLADASDGDILGPEFESLFGMDGAGALNFIQPDGASMPTSVGMVMLVNMEATPEVGEDLPEGMGEEGFLDPVGGQQSED